MSERKREVKTYLVDKICPKCGVGIMQCDYSVALVTYPARYVHRCPHCKWTEDYMTAYPRIEYENVEPKEKE